MSHLPSNSRSRPTAHGRGPYRTLSGLTALHHEPNDPCRMRPRLTGSLPAANASWMAPVAGQDPGEQLNWVGMAATAGAGGTM
jgi:hypothetical protein